MLTKLYYSVANQPENAYAAGGTNEKAQSIRIGEAFAAAARAYGYQVKIGGYDRQMAEKVAEANTWGADLYIPGHTNAGGTSKGTMTMCYPGREANPYVQAIHNRLAQLTPWADPGLVTRTDLYEINATHMLACYLEVAFHDKPDSAQWIIDHAPLIGQTIADAIAAVDHKTVTPLTPTPAPANPALSDGIVGPATIRVYQARNGLTTDGIAGTDTITTLQRRTTAPYTDGWYDGQYDSLVSDSWPALTAYRTGGHGSPSVAALQRFLGVTPDGLLGPATATAFQTAVREARL